MPKIIAVIFATMFSLGMSYLMLLGAGFSDSPSIIEIGLFSLLLLSLFYSQKAFYVLLVPIVLLYVFYTPIGLKFGAPSYQYVASVFATDLKESQEFFSQIPLKNFLMAGAILLLLIANRWFIRRYQLDFARNKTFVVLGFLLFFLHSSSAKFLQEGTTSIEKVIAELKRLNSLSIESRWGKSQLVDSNYDDYVLIIGESARKDYHHAFGYPVENTPFMSNAKGTLVDGLTAGGTNTIASLKLMLTQPDTQKWEGDYSLNLVDLVKSAGIKTYWLSNQGYLGTFDTPISAIAKKSDEAVFLKAGDSLNQNISDFKLLPKFKQLLHQKAAGKRFIVLHLYGSHPISCDRLTDYPSIFEPEKIAKKYHNVNCYISSIKKTDELLKQVHQALVENKGNRRFSMIYFSDHGLAHHITENSIEIHNSSGKSKLHLDIPLFKISSDDQQQQRITAFKSGLNFTNGIANWIGIRNERLNPHRSLFSAVDDESDYGLKKIIESFDVELDPAVVIPQ